MDLIKREELASQVLAIIQATFTRPKLSEIEAILDSARRQAKSTCSQGLE